MTDDLPTGESQDQQQVPNETPEILLTPSISSPTPPPVPADYDPNAGQPPPPPQGQNPDSMNKAKSYLLKLGKFMIFLTIIGSCLLLFGAYLISSTINRVITEYMPQ